MPRLQLVRIWLCQPRPHSLLHALSQRHAAPRLKLGRVRGACGWRQSGSGGRRGGDVSARVRSAVSASEKRHALLEIALPTPPLTHTHPPNLPVCRPPEHAAATHGRGPSARGLVCVSEGARVCAFFGGRAAVGIATRRGRQDAVKLSLHVVVHLPPGGVPRCTRGQQLRPHLRATAPAWQAQLVGQNRRSVQSARRLTATIDNRTVAAVHLHHAPAESCAARSGIARWCAPARPRPRPRGLPRARLGRARPAAQAPARRAAAPSRACSRRAA